MAVFVAKRVAYVFGVLAIVLVVVSLLLRMIPGDPVDVISAGNPGITEDDKHALREQLGLNDHPLAQIGRYLGGLTRGDMGDSLRFREPVSSIVFERVPATLELSLFAFVVALSIALPLGVVMALKRNQPADYAGSVLVVLGFSIPSFLLGILLILVLSVELRLLPSSGRGASVFEAVAAGDPGELRRALSFLVLPGVALGVSLAAVTARMVRSSMLETLRQDYVRFARAKGVPARTVLVRHAFRTALVPVVTVLGLQIGYLLSGAFVIENVFAWPGIGRLSVQAIFWRDYPVVQGVVLVSAVLFLFVNLLVDLLYAVIDPRIRLG